MLLRLGECLAYTQANYPEDNLAFKLLHTAIVLLRGGVIATDTHYINQKHAPTSLDCFSKQDKKHQKKEPAICLTLN